MNTQPSPLVPQGSFLEQKNRGRARVKIAVFFVLAVHGIGLMALLMQGCRREEPAASEATNDLTTASNPMPPVLEPSNPPIAEPSAPVAPDTGVVAAPTSTVPPVVAPMPPEMGGLTEYKVAKGDSFYTIARKFHVTVKAIADANPGVDSTKLQIGQKLNIPAPSAAPATPTTSGGETAGGMQTYKVKSGDTLSKIASQYGTTVKAIMNENNLSTTRITVGQVLKVPAKAGSMTPPAETTTPSGTTQP